MSNDYDIVFLVNFDLFTVRFFLIQPVKLRSRITLAVNASVNST